MDQIIQHNYNDNITNVTTVITNDNIHNNNTIKEEDNDIDNNDNDNTNSYTYDSNLKQYICNYDGNCNKSYAKLKHINRHILTAHSADKPFKCPYNECASIGYTRKEHLNRHINNAHMNIKKYACTINNCNHKYFTPQHLKRHIQSHHNSTNTKHNDKSSIASNDMETKSIDNNISDSAPIIKKPKKLKDPNKPKHHHKHICKFIIHNSVNNNDELKDNDSNNNVSNNIECGQAFTLKSELQYHIKAFHGAKLYLCGIDNCALEFNKMSELTKHKHHQHSNHNNHRVKCSYMDCHKDFSNQSNLNMHIKSDHLGLRPKCDRVECNGKDFSTKQKLQEHMLWHQTKDVNKANGIIENNKRKVSAIDSLIGAKHPYHKNKRKRDDMNNDAINSTIANDDSLDSNNWIDRINSMISNNDSNNIISNDTTGSQELPQLEQITIDTVNFAASIANNLFASTPNTITGNINASENNTIHHNNNPVVDAVLS